MSDINVDLFYFINHNLQNPLFDMVMSFITNLGGFVSLFIICIAVIILSKIFKNDTVKKIAILSLISLLLADGIALILKLLVHEPRPFMALDNVRLLVVENDLNSFPSGHTTSTFSIISILIIKLKNSYIKIILAVCGFLIAFSRIYVGVHYPFDVIAGALVGIVSAYLVCFAENGKIRKKLGF